MLPLLLPIGALLAGVALMLLGTGLLNTLLALRGSLEGFSDHTLGLIGSAYFLGFFAGTFVAPPLIRRIGHVRAFAFFAAAAAACVLLHALFTNAAFWMLLRVATGIALVGFYTVIESWLNSQAPGTRRGQVFAVYMAVNLFALAGAQQFLHLDSPASFTLFAVAAICVMLALMPVVATRLPPPPLSDTPRLPLARLWAAAPVATAGALASGLAMGAFWGLGAVYAGRLGLDDSGVARFITVAILAGALLQWPMGRLSDSMDRRRALALIAATAAAGGLLMAALGPFGHAVLLGVVVFGGAAFAVYPVVVAHLIDHLHHDEILAGNAALLLVHGAAAALGPAVAGALMSALGAAALPLFFALMFAPAAAFAWLQARQGRDQIVDEAAHFMPMLRTSPAVLELMTPEQLPATATTATDPAGASRAQAG
jgi:MFS family permease